MLKLINPIMTRPNITIILTTLPKIRNISDKLFNIHITKDQLYFLY